MSHSAGPAENPETPAPANGMEAGGAPPTVEAAALDQAAVEVSPPEAAASANAPIPSCYTCSQLEAEFRQGEILTGLEQVIKISPDGTAQVIQHSFAVIFSQDCDLAADHRARQIEGGTPAMNGILLFEAFPLDNFIGSLGYNSSERKQVRQNNNVRYHVLVEGAAADDLQSEGFSALAIDFRRYFTLTQEDIAGQLGQSARRRSRLISPYVEHLQSRALHYLGRVALPDTE